MIKNITKKIRGLKKNTKKIYREKNKEVIKEYQKKIGRKKEVIKEHRKKQNFLRNFQDDGR